MSAISKVAQSVARLLMKTPLRRLPGLDAVYKHLYRMLTRPGVVIIEAQGSRIYVERRDIGIALFLRAESVHEPALTQLLNDLLRPGMVFVDAGANIGYFSLLGARLVGDQGHVYAFEPAPRNFELLARSIELNSYQNITASPCALSSGRSTQTLYLDRANHGDVSLAATNVPTGAEGVEVETISLDEFLDREAPGVAVDVLKVDTQGAEGLVLEGARRTLANPSLRVIMEFWPWGLRNLGTDPELLLHTLRDLEFDVRRLDEATARVVRLGDTELVADCVRRQHGKGFTTLILQREPRIR